METESKKMTWNEFQHVAQLWNSKNLADTCFEKWKPDNTDAVHKAITGAIVLSNGFSLDHRTKLVSLAYQKHYK